MGPGKKTLPQSKRAFKENSCRNSPLFLSDTQIVSGISDGISMISSRVHLAKKVSKQGLTSPGSEIGADYVRGYSVQC